MKLSRLLLFLFVLSTFALTPQSSHADETIPQTQNSEVEPNCGVISVLALAQMTLRPGQTVPAKVTVEVRVAGSVQQMVTLATSDPARPLIYLTMRGTAPQNLEVSPQSLNFQVQQGETKDRFINIVGPPDFEVLNCTSDTPQLKVTKQLISKDATRVNWKVQVTLADTTTGSLKSLLTIKTSHPERPEITIPITTAVQGDLQMTPNTAFFGFVKKGTPQKIEVKIAARSGQPFQILSAQPPQNANLRVEVPLRRSAPIHTIKIEFDPTTATFVEGSIELQTDFLKEPLLLIPVTAYVEEALPGQNQAAQLPRAEDDPTNIIGVARPTLRVGERAPEFVVNDANGQQWRLSDLQGEKNLLLTFFPKCFTGGCANHLSSLRDYQSEFNATDTQILAVSVDAADGEKGQQAFASKWKLGFPLLPDTSRALSMQFGAAQNGKQLAARMSILIDKRGIVRWIDTDVHVQTHGADVLAKIAELGLS